MNKLVLVALLGFAAVANAGVTISANSFCQRYTAAVFAASGGDTAANEQALLGAVVNGAVLGRNCSVASASCANNVTGIFNQPNQQAFFPQSIRSGQPLTDLSNHLQQFFGIAMGCRLWNPTYAGVASMKTVHLNMAITETVWGTFVGEIVSILTSYGVPMADVGTPVIAGTGELAYLGALLAQFKRGATGTNEICKDATCTAATAFTEVTQASDANGLCWADAAGNCVSGSGTAISIALNGNVKWSFGLAHNVFEADSAFAAKASPTFASTAASGTAGNTKTYTKQFATAGTYYFVCGIHPTLMRGVITVGATPSGASALSASVALLAAALAAVFALKH